MSSDAGGEAQFSASRSLANGPCETTGRQGLEEAYEDGARRLPPGDSESPMESMKTIGFSGDGGSA